MRLMPNPDLSWADLRTIACIGTLRSCMPAQAFPAETPPVVEVKGRGRLAQVVTSNSHRVLLRVVQIVRCGDPAFIHLR